MLDDYPFTVLVWRHYKVSFHPRVVYLYRHHEDNIHKDFWRWLPARLQVIAELVEPERRLEALAFFLLYLAGVLLNQGNALSSFRLAVAGLLLSEGAENKALAYGILKGVKG